MKTPKFKAWHATECARRLGKLKDIDKAVDKMMKPQHLKVEEF